MYERSRIYTKNLLIRVSDDDLFVLDDRRGDMTRSAYLRHLIHQPDEVVIEASTNGGSTGRRTAPRRPRRTDNHLVAVADADRHLHRYKRTGEPDRYDKGNALYIYVCECGAEKVDT